MDDWQQCTCYNGHCFMLMLWDFSAGAVTGNSRSEVSVSLDGSGCTQIGENERKSWSLSEPFVPTEESWRNTAITISQHVIRCHKQLFRMNAPPTRHHHHCHSRAISHTHVVPILLVNSRLLARTREAEAERLFVNLLARMGSTLSTVNVTKKREPSHLLLSSVETLFRLSTRTVFSCVTNSCVVVVVGLSGLTSSLLFG